MTAPNNIPIMTDCPQCQHQLDDHEERILAVEKRQDAAESKLDTIGRDIIAIRAEGNARAGAASAGMDRLSTQVLALSQTVSEHIGATLERSRIDQERLTLEQIKLARIKRYATIIGIFLTLCGVVAGSILSSQTWDDYFFGGVSFLHHKHTEAS